ncbi:MAG: lipoyl synthase [Candidatus Delongbacteria bacterium]|nr:lipoyl synthase [Candidatus Delongbacteria bacterium]
MPSLYKPRVRIPSGSRVTRLSRLLRQQQLHTVCEEAHCPNKHECWSQGTATFLILGDSCTRGCRFCNITQRDPLPPDPDEARRVANAVATLDLQHVVITSVTRDDLPDGGASAFAAVLAAVQATTPAVTTEVLIPDLQGNREALDQLLQAAPTVVNHNVETVPSLYRLVRPQAVYTRSLQLLSRAARRGFYTKSGMMLGLGETEAEVYALLDDLRQVDCRFVTIGQYLQPGHMNLPVNRYVTASEFERYAGYARKIGFHQVQASPLVRSSYHAGDFMATTAR